MYKYLRIDSDIKKKMYDEYMTQADINNRCNYYQIFVIR